MRIGQGITRVVTNTTTVRDILLRHAYERIYAGYEVDYGRVKGRVGYAPTGNDDPVAGSDV